jgi:hypothetical protein
MTTDRVHVTWLDDDHPDNGPRPPVVVPWWVNLPSE